MTHPYEHPKEKAKAPPSASSSTATLVANSSFSKSTTTLVGGSDFSASKSMLVAEEKGKTPLSAFRSTSTLVEDETKKIFSCAFVAEKKKKGPPSTSWSTATADKRFSASTSTLVEEETKKVFLCALVAEEREKRPPSASAPASTSDTGPQSRAPAAAGAIGKAKGRSERSGVLVYKGAFDGQRVHTPVGTKRQVPFPFLDGSEGVETNYVGRITYASNEGTVGSRELHLRSAPGVQHNDQIWSRAGLDDVYASPVTFAPPTTGGGVSSQGSGCRSAD